MCMKRPKTAKPSAPPPTPAAPPEVMIGGEEANETAAVRQKRKQGFKKLRSERNPGDQGDGANLGENSGGDLRIPR